MAFRNSEALWAYAADVYPRYPRFYVSQVRVVLQSDHRERVIPILDRCLRENPNSPECAAPLGGFLLSFDPAKGEEILRAILPRDIGGGAHLRLAQHWSDHGKTRAAVDLFEGWVQRTSTASPEMLGALVDLAIADGQFDKARAYLLRRVQSASVLQPASPPEAGAVVAAAERAGDPVLAERARTAAQRCTRSDCFARALSPSGAVP